MSWGYYVQNLCGENEFYLHENKKSFSYQWLHTWLRFEREAWGNLEMPILHNDLHFYIFSLKN